MNLVFASNNSKKTSEILPLLPQNISLINLQDISIVDDIPETGNTFEENALQKAMYVWERRSLPVFADDSGLEVLALNGAPGVFSARYAGVPKNDSKNVEMLLHNMKGKTDRKARFITVIALLGFGNPLFFEGEIKGEITEQPLGNSGFGYDPVFVPEGCSETFAEMSLEQKNLLSHRRKAIDKMIIFLNNNV